jgi:hypothetical protein
MDRLSDAAATSPDFATTLQNEPSNVQQAINSGLGGVAELDAASPAQKDRFYYVLNKLFEDAPGYREPKHIQNNINSALKQSGLA